MSKEGQKILKSVTATSINILNQVLMDVQKGRNVQKATVPRNQSGVSYRRTEVSQHVLELMKTLLQVRTLIPAAVHLLAPHITYRHTQSSHRCSSYAVYVKIVCDRLVLIMLA